MFPLFYVGPDLRQQLSHAPQKGYMPVVKQGDVFGIITEDKEFKELEDQTWVVSTFKKMLFLDQCYWD